MIKKFYHLILDNIKHKKIEKLLEINSYLENFDYNPESLQNEPPKEDGNYIWQLWLQGENNIPPMVRKCLDSVKKYCPYNYKIIVLDNEKVKKYIEIDKNIEYKYKNKLISNAHYSDYIRTCLLEKYGGIWIDATVLLTGKIPDKILNQQFFVFKNPIWYEHKKVPSENLFKVFLSIDKESGFYGSNWFIVAKNDCLIVKIQKYLLEQYWNKENSLCNYFLYHFFISKTLIKNEICKNIFENMYSCSNRATHFLQNMLKEKFCALEFEEIKNTTPIHKLTYKYKKVIPNSFLEHILQNYKGDN